MDRPFSCHPRRHPWHPDKYKGLFLDRGMTRS